MWVSVSKTISFVASDELAEYLEEEAERRMTTVSSTAQMLLAEAVTSSPDGRDGPESVGGGAQPDQEDEGGDVAQPDQEQEVGDVFDRHSEAWYLSNGKRKYAVHVPDDADVSDHGKRRYYKTDYGAAEALRRWYE